MIESTKSDVIGGLRFPRFPTDSLQAQFVGSSNENALREAFQFYDFHKSEAVKAGSSLNETTNILDFGTGWGRFLRFFWKDVEEDRLHGVDIDPEILETCKMLGVPGELRKIEPLGSLPYDDASMGAILAYSVFTHLPELFHRNGNAQSYENGNAQSYESASGLVKIQLTTSGLNSGLTFDGATNNRVTVARAGKYLVAASIEFSSVVANSYFYCAPQKNGSGFYEWISHSSSTGNVSAGGAVIAALAEGDYIELFTFCNNDSTIEGSSSKTYLSLTYLGSV